jgi:ubiquinone/menaquinone biosynthesis C-methylase UbiE
MTPLTARGRRYFGRTIMNSPNAYTLSGSAAEMYEHNMVPAIFKPFADDLLEFADLTQGETVLDVACGTGIVSRLAWPKVAPKGRVVGLDVNPKMLEVARRAEHKESAIEWTEGSATAIPLPDDSFDVVLCQHGLQYFPDRPSALREMHRMLGDRGRLILNVWRPVKYNPGHAIFADVLQQRVNDEAAATRRAPFKLSDRDELRELVINAGFRDVIVSLTARVARFPSAEAMVRIMIAGTPLGAAMNQQDASILQQVIDEVTAGLAEYNDDRGLAVPMQGWLVTARA